MTGPQVLLIDDDPDFRECYRQILQLSLGVDAVAVASLAEARQVLERGGGIPSGGGRRCPAR